MLSTYIHILKMSTCAGTTAKKAPCKKPGKYQYDGKLYCNLHVPNKEAVTSTAPASKAKAAAKASVVEEELIDEMAAYEEIGAAAAARNSALDFFDIAENRNSWILPRNIKAVVFEGISFMNAEHAFHCMKFYYPAPSNITNSVLEAFRAVCAATSMDQVRSLSAKNGPYAKYILPKWEKEFNGVPHCEMVMMTILDKACKNSASLREKISSITTDFEDTEFLVIPYVPGYCNVLKALGNHIRNG